MNDDLLADLSLARSTSSPWTYARRLLDLLDDDVSKFQKAMRPAEEIRLGRIVHARAACVLAALAEVHPAQASPASVALARRPAMLALIHCAPFATARMKKAVEAIAPAVPASRQVN